MMDDTEIIIDNYNHYINLSSSWTNETVVFNQIQKSAPVLNYITLWPDSANNSSFYAWAGELSRALPPDQMFLPPPNWVWRFTASDSEGSWSEQLILSYSIFPSLTRPAGGIDAYGNGIGYLLGEYKYTFMSPQTI
jgi:hypothetical protein